MTASLRDALVAQGYVTRPQAVGHARPRSPAHYTLFSSMFLLILLH